LTKKEFRMLHQVFKTQSPPSKHLELTWKFGMPAFLNYQLHLLARIDNTIQITIDNIRVHNEFSNCLKTKLNWSKNVQEERDAPRQMMMGRKDWDYCVLISIGLWLKLNLMTNGSVMMSPYLFSFSGDITIRLGGQKSKDIAQNSHRDLQKNSHNNSFCTYCCRPGHQKGNCLKLKNKMNRNNDTSNHSNQNQNLNGIAFTSIMIQKALQLTFGFWTVVQVTNSAGQWKG
jgi:hypothetical protein